MIGSIELITPPIAQAMLAKQARNRKITRSLIRRYAEEMRAGRWNTNGQGIILSDDGELLDGQHRLEAVVECGLAIEMFVVRGVPKERFETMDSGRSRTTGDVLAAQGYANYNQLAAIARLAWNYASGVSVGYLPSKTQIIEFIYAFPYLTDVTARVVNAATPLPNSPLGAILFLANAGHQRLEAKAAEYLKGVATGEDLKKGDPRLTLREWFFYNRARTGGSISPEASFVAIARSWNAFAEDRDLVAIKLMATPTKKVLPIYDYDPEHFAGVEDLAAKLAATRSANFSNSPVRVDPGQYRRRAQA